MRIASLSARHLSILCSASVISVPLAAPCSSCNFSAGLKKPAPRPPPPPNSRLPSIRPALRTPPSSTVHPGPAPDADDEAVEGSGSHLSDVARALLGWWWCGLEKGAAPSSPRKRPGACSEALWLRKGSCEERWAGVAKDVWCDVEEKGNEDNEEVSRGSSRSLIECSALSLSNRLRSAARSVSLASLAVASSAAWETLPPPPTPPLSLAVSSSTSLALFFSLGTAVAPKECDPALPVESAGALLLFRPPHPSSGAPSRLADSAASVTTGRTGLCSKRERHESPPIRAKRPK